MSPFRCVFLLSGDFPSFLSGDFASFPWAYRQQAPQSESSGDNEVVHNIQESN